MDENEATDVTGDSLARVARHVDTAVRHANVAAGSDPLSAWLDLTVVTVALHPRDAATFLGHWAGEPTPWFDLVRRCRPLAPDARVLGYEVVGAEETLDFHSWHCHAYADEVAEALGIVVNDRGLLSTLEDARSVLRWMLDLPDAEAPKPVPWTVVALAALP